MKFRVLVIAALAAVSLGCSRPVSYEKFIRIEDKGEDGQYHYTLDMTDSLCTYDIYFFSRIDCNRHRLAEVRDFPLNVTWISPDGIRYAEKVYFGVHDDEEGEDYYSRQYKFLYRSGLVPVRHGEWEMMVRIDSDRFVPGFRGLGVICKKNL